MVAQETPPPAPRVTLATLNRSTREEFVETLGTIFEDTPSVAATSWADRPFASVDELHRAMCAVVRGFDDEHVLTLLRAHPELGARRPMADASVQEQRGAGLDRLGQSTAEQLAALNVRYREKFGFPF